MKKEVKSIVMGRTGPRFFQYNFVTNRWHSIQNEQNKLLSEDFLLRSKEGNAVLMQLTCCNEDGDSFSPMQQQIVVVD